MFFSFVESLDPLRTLASKLQAWRLNEREREIERETGRKCSSGVEGDVVTRFKPEYNSSVPI